MGGWGVSIVAKDDLRSSLYILWGWWWEVSKDEKEFDKLETQDFEFKFAERYGIFQFSIAISS